MKLPRHARLALYGAGLFISSLPGMAMAEPGRLLASQCAQCHGTNGAGPGFDNIAGKNAGELYHELVEMKYRPIESIMDRQARGYTEEQLQLIANYLSTQAGGGDN